MEKLFDSVKEAENYLGVNFNGHGTIISSRTGKIISTCRCISRPEGSIVYADDNGEYNPHENPFPDYMEKNLTVLTPNDSLDDVRNAVFLAGPSSRGSEPIGWREEFIRVFNSYGFKGVILNPENPNNGEFTQEKYINQVEWERKAMMIATRIVFWIPRTKENLALTTNIELGEWYDKDGVYVGYPLLAEHVRYIGKRCEMIGKQCYHKINDMVGDIMKDLKDKPRTYFTSDTHFGAQRTFELSMRPFASVEDMDLHLISNWNKTVRDCDTVYHLGDFGDFQAFRNLNCSKMVLVKGNYETENPSMNRIDYKENSINVAIDGKKYNLVHKPMDGKDFMLYGHIHGTQLVKKNGINVGIDCNNYKPVSTTRIKFLRNAIENFYDENVF